MMTYIRINLASLSADGQPGPLPAALIGLSEASLVDLPAAIKPVPPQFSGVGYWPVVEADVSAPELDAKSQRYLTPFPPIPPVPVPFEVTMRQARLSLSRAGILPAASQAIAAMPGVAGDEARIEWEFAATLRRDHPLVAGLGQVLSLNAQAIDNLFIAAAQIP